MENVLALGERKIGGVRWRSSGLRWIPHRRPRAHLGAVVRCRVRMALEGEWTMVEDPHYESEGRGRGRKKKEAQAVEALAVRMVASTEALCSSLPLTDELREELDQARRIKSRTARKRQLKRLASLLRRDEDSVIAIQATFDAEGRTNRTEREFFHRIEELRDGLCDPDRFTQTLERASSDLPGLNREKFTRLAKRVHLNSDKAASREIFRTLRALAETQSEA